MPNKMAWLGSTSDTLDVQRHVSSHITSLSSPNTVLVTDQKGSLKSSAVTGEELGHLAGATGNLQQQLVVKLGMKKSSSAFQSKITDDSLPLSCVMGRVTHVILADAKASAMATRIAMLEARTIVAAHRVFYVELRGRQHEHSYCISQTSDQLYRYSHHVQ